MAKFKRRVTTIIEASQFFKNKPPYPDGVVYSPILRQEPYVHIWHGRAFLHDGDWVAIMEDGATVVVPPDAFKELFELVEFAQESVFPDAVGNLLTEAEWKAAYPEQAFTWDLSGHPENYDDICACRDCRLYSY